MSHRGVIRVTLRLSGRGGGDNLNFASENATTIDRRARRDGVRGLMTYRLDIFGKTT